MVFLIIELSYIRVLKGMKLPVGAEIRIDYKRVFLISEFLISGIHRIQFLVEAFCKDMCPTITSTSSFPPDHTAHTNGRFTNFRQVLQNRVLNWPSNISLKTLDGLVLFY